MATDNTTSLFELLNIFQNAKVENKTEFERYIRSITGNNSGNSTEIRELIEENKLMKQEIDDLKYKMSKLYINDPSLAADYELMGKISTNLNQKQIKLMKDLVLLSGVQFNITYKYSSFPLRYFSTKMKNKDGKQAFYAIDTLGIQHLIEMDWSEHLVVVTGWFFGKKIILNVTLDIGKEYILFFRNDGGTIELVGTRVEYIIDDVNGNVTSITQDLGYGKIAKSESKTQFISFRFITNTENVLFCQLDERYGRSKIDGTGFDYQVDEIIWPRMSNRMVKQSEIAKLVEMYVKTEKSLIAQLKKDETGNTIVDLTLQNSAALERLTNLVSDISQTATEVKAVNLDIDNIISWKAGPIASGLLPNYVSERAGESNIITAEWEPTDLKYYHGHAVTHHNGFINVSTPWIEAPNILSDYLNIGDITEPAYVIDDIVGKGKDVLQCKIRVDQSFEDFNETEKGGAVFNWARMFNWTGEAGQPEGYEDTARFESIGDIIGNVVKPVSEKITVMIWSKEWAKAPKAIQNVSATIKVKYSTVPKPGAVPVTDTITDIPIISPFEFKDEGITYGAIKYEIDTSLFFKKHKAYALLYHTRIGFVETGNQSLPPDDDPVERIDKVFPFQKDIIYVGDDRRELDYTDKVHYDVKVMFEEGTYTMTSYPATLNEHQRIFAYEIDDLTDLEKFKHGITLMPYLDELEKSDLLSHKDRMNISFNLLPQYQMHIFLKLYMEVETQGKPITGNESWDPSLNTKDTILKQLKQMSTSNLEKSIIEDNEVALLQTEMEKVESQLEAKESILQVIEEFAMTIAPEVAMAIQLGQGLIEFLDGIENKDFVELFDGLAAMLPSIVSTWRGKDNFLNSFFESVKGKTAEELPNAAVSACRTMFLKKVKEFCNKFGLKFESWMMGKTKELTTEDIEMDVFKNGVEDLQDEFTKKFEEFKGDAKKELLSHIKLEMLDQNQKHALQTVIMSIGGWLFDRIKGKLHLDEIWADAKLKLDVFKSKFDKFTKTWFKDGEVEKALNRFKLMMPDMDYDMLEFTIILMQGSGRDEKVSILAYDVQDSFNDIVTHREKYGLKFGALSELLKLHRGDGSCTLPPKYLSDMHIEPQTRTTSAVYKLIHHLPIVQGAYAYINEDGSKLIDNYEIISYGYGEIYFGSALTYTIKVHVVWHERRFEVEMLNDNIFVKHNFMNKDPNKMKLRLKLSRNEKVPYVEIWDPESQVRTVKAIGAGNMEDMIMVVVGSADVVSL